MTDTNDTTEESVPLERLIGTGTCSYCHLESECLMLPSELQACEPCIHIAFTEYWGAE